MKLQYKITLMITSILFMTTWLISFLIFGQFQNFIKEQMDSNAMDIAITIASMENIQETLHKQKETGDIQTIVENIRKDTRFQYIIILDMDSNVYSYPIEYALGKKYKGEGHERALLNGETYISEDENKLISAIRAFKPIYYNNEQVGIVIVGLLNDTIIQEVKPQIYISLLAIFFALIIGTIVASIISKSIKKTIFGLEPSEIALLLGQRDLILQNIKNGILAIDNNGKLIFFNRTAQIALGFKDADKGKSISNFHSRYTEELMNVMNDQQPVYNQEIKICPGKILLCSHTLLRDYKDEIIGVVSNFQDLTEVKLMAEELTGIKKVTSALRSQNHEFMNKLHTISGLIQLEEYDSAIKYISDISHKRNEFSQILTEKIRNVHVAALLLTKYNKATERRIDFEIDKNSYISDIPESISVDELCSVLGNLIENAIDELVKQENGIIIIKLNSNKDGLSLRISDNGTGIPKEISDKIFKRGFTTKNGNRGFGLNIVKQIIDSANGKINVINDKGTIWDIFIPVERGENNDQCLDS